MRLHFELVDRVRRYNRYAYEDAVSVLGSGSGSERPALWSEDIMIHQCRILSLSLTFNPVYHHDAGELSYTPFTPRANLLFTPSVPRFAEGDQLGRNSVKEMNHLLWKRDSNEWRWCALPRRPPGSQASVCCSGGGS